MRIAVLGAGVVGVTAAWYLAERGHAVTLIERERDVATGTSYANGGQVSATSAAPWAAPGVPMQALRWLGRADAPLKWRPRPDPRQWRWLYDFLRRCTPDAYAQGLSRNVRLGLLSLAELRGLRARLNLSYDAQTRGILKLAKSPDDLAALTAKVPQLQAMGVRVRALSAADCVAVEPALAGAVARGEVTGGLHYEDDESGDACLFTQGLASAAAARGVDLRLATTITGFDARGRRIDAVLTDKGPVETDHVVLSLGSDSPALARRLGLSLPVYPVKGYSLTVPLSGGNTAPVVSITDEERRIVVSRLGDRLRVAGMAELAGADRTTDPRRVAAVRAALAGLFPEVLETAAEPVPWTGLRPMTPDGGPLIGPAGGWTNLTLNTGHGTYGWTMACGSARLVADLVDGAPPPLDPGPYSAARFGW